MSIEGINISLAEVRATANTLRRINQDLLDKLGEVKTQMDNLSTSWQSDAANTIRERFTAFSPRFQEYWNVIDSYATFLDTAATEYDTNETNINNNASAFK